jgi:hypothetical protein
MTFTIGFTAARNVAKGSMGESVIRYTLAQLPPADRYVTGGCWGGEAIIGLWLYRARPRAEHVVVVPANRSQVSPWWEGVQGGRITLIFMEPGTTYKDRNTRIVMESNQLCGFPAYEENDSRSLRSGTWQTLRLGVKHGIPTEWHTVQPPFTGDVRRNEMRKRA